MKKVLVCGSGGMVGSALVKKINNSKNYKAITCTRKDADLCNYNQVDEFIKIKNPDIVINCAAKVGGIHANKTYPAEFISENLKINLNIIDSSYKNGIKKLINLGSSCIYPSNIKRPITEKDLLSDSLEETNEAYALAKICGVHLCKHYRAQYNVSYHSLMPTNLYGYNDNYHPENSHVLPALLRRFHEAKENGDQTVEVWGSGRPIREFLHADDLADAILYVLNLKDIKFDFANVGTGFQFSIKELCEKIKSVTGFDGEIYFNNNGVDGTLIKNLNRSILHDLGWEPSISFYEGLVLVYEDFLKSYKSNNLRSV